MNKFLIDLLTCPACHGELSWSMVDTVGDQVETAQATCQACEASYPVRDGIGLFLTPDLPREDLWENVESGISAYLRQNPEIEARLMEAPPESLNPADQFFRAHVLEDLGELHQAKALLDQAEDRMYPQAYFDCRQSQIDFVLSQLPSNETWVMDLACGRGALVEEILRRTNLQLVATDFSPQILRRNRRWFEMAGFSDRISLLAFDARRTPFNNDTVPYLTTFLGLPNIQDPQNLCAELRRIVSGRFWGISHFFPQDDEPSRQVAEELQVAQFLFALETRQAFDAAGWTVELANPCSSPAHPTPVGQVLEGAAIDSLPQTDTVLDWRVILGS